MSNELRKLTFVYYCSGHGYGHATRVSAFARQLLSLGDKLAVHIVSSAPKHVFSDSTSQGALYRHADIDPVIVQPLAYRVDRRKSVEVLEKFLQDKEAKVCDEAQWLKSIHADCVLSDAAFLGCLAAHHAGIPSVLITNFSFDAVYSYLSTSLVDEPVNRENPPLDTTLSLSSHSKDALEPDVPIASEELAPLVKQIHDGYRCADLLLRLPGTIPLPSFAVHPGLPSPDWVDIEHGCFKSFVVDHLMSSPLSYQLLPQIPFPNNYPRKPLQREVRQAPLLVRPTDPAVYTPQGRSRLLDSIGVPTHLHDPATTKILIVSFGGQVFHKPHSRSHSRTPSKVSTPDVVPPVLSDKTVHHRDGALKQVASPSLGATDPERHAQALSEALQNATNLPPVPLRAIPSRLASQDDHTHGRPRGLSQLRIEGAPFASVPTSPRATSISSFSSVPTFQTVTIPPTPRAAGAFEKSEPQRDQDVERETTNRAVDDTNVRILPDDSWIAVVCGVSKDWGREDGEELPENFFVAPRDVYMPDLTAVADVLLGKLGYGTVSECVDACTPFVYVPRPLFIEEHGLRMYLNHEGVGVELSRMQYEVGEWVEAVEKAWVLGRHAKEEKRKIGETGKRTEESRKMAQSVVDWVDAWQAGLTHSNGTSEERGSVGPDR